MRNKHVCYFACSDTRRPIERCAQIDTPHKPQIINILECARVRVRTKLDRWKMRCTEVAVTAAHCCTRTHIFHRVRSFPFAQRHFLFAMPHTYIVLFFSTSAPSASYSRPSHQSLLIARHDFFMSYLHNELAH